MDTEAQRKACQVAKLFSRVEPAHKSKIVDYLQKDGAIAAMVRSCGKQEQSCVGAIFRIVVYVLQYKNTLHKCGMGANYSPPAVVLELCSVLIAVVV